MARLNFTSGAVLSESDLDELGRQAVSNVTTAQRAALSPSAGEFVVDTDLKRYMGYTGSAWTIIGWYDTAGRVGVELTDAAQSISSGSSAAITWGTEVRDPDGWTSASSSEIVVPTGFAGIYVCTFSALWASSSLGTNPAISVQINGSTQYGDGGTTPYGVHSITFVRALAEADLIECFAIQNSGGAVNVTSRFLATFIGR